MTKVLYVCGYGRSGSTTLGQVLAHETQGVCIGEATHLARREFVDKAVCACGNSFDTCPFWARVEDELRGRDSFRGLSPWATVALESQLGLLLPMALLRRLVRRVPFSSRYGHTDYATGLSAVAAAADGVLVDTSKTTRRTANRARMISACGISVSTYLAARSSRDVTTSYIAAGRREGRDRPWRRARLIVGVGRLMAHVSARVVAHSLRVPLIVVSLEETLGRDSAIGERQADADHSIAGNRRRLTGMAGASVDL